MSEVARTFSFFTFALVLEKVPSPTANLDRKSAEEGKGEKPLSVVPAVWHFHFRTPLFCFNVMN